MSTLVRYDVVDSTQEVAKGLVGKAEHGACVVAFRQTAGRGRLGRTWTGPEDGLFLSMVLYPKCPLRHAQRITLGAARGMLDALDSLGIHARVKWPNDVVLLHPSGVNGRIGPFRKVSGLLVEVARTTGDQLDACVLGIGVNIKGPKAGWPEEIALTAGSLDDVGFVGAADDVLEAIRAHVPAAITRALADFDDALAILRDRSATLGRRVEVDGIIGVARALDVDGALVIVDDEGVSRAVRAGDVWIA